MCLLDGRSTYALLGASLGISASEAHAAVRRLSEARLVDPESGNIQRQLLLDFILHGVGVVFPARLGESTRGVATAWAAPIMANRIVQNRMTIPVWPSPEGKVRGMAVKPLYPSAVEASARDPRLYDLLALVDALRLGRARERAIAEEELTKQLLNNG